MTFMGVERTSPYLETPFNGHIGLGPYSGAEDEGSFVPLNYLYGLKQQGKLEHDVVSFFAPNTTGQGFVKFGAIDPKCVNDSKPLEMIKTNSTKSWALKGSRQWMIINEYDEDRNQDKHLIDI